MKRFWFVIALGAVGMLMSCATMIPIGGLYTGAKSLHPVAEGRGTYFAGEPAAGGTKCPARSARSARDDRAIGIARPIMKRKHWKTTMPQDTQPKPKGLPGAQAARAAELVNYQDGAIVSREIVKKPTGTVTVFAFDEGKA